jgi:hypothetical protein
LQDEGKKMNEINEPHQFNMSQIILYHLLPGIPILLTAIVCANPEYGFGLPIFLSLMIAIMVGLIPKQRVFPPYSATRKPCGNFTAPWRGYPCPRTCLSP